jgi:curved DNA-binding protein CbpA
MRRSLYDLLGVRPDDDAEKLKMAFRKAAKDCHPDHHGDDPEAAARFRQIAEAYDVLRDAEQRAAYDRLLEVERRPLRSKLKSALSGAKRHLIADAIIGVILTIGLASGYDLYFHTSATPAEVAAVQPPPQSSGAERDRLAGAPAPQMPIALPIENPLAPGDSASVGPTIAVAGRDSGSDIPFNQAGPDNSANSHGDGAQDRHDAQSSDVQVPSSDIQVPAADTHNGIPGPASSGVTAPADKPGSKTPETVGANAGIVKQPAETRMSARLHAAMKRPHASRTHFRRPRWCINTSWPTSTRNIAGTTHLLLSGAGLAPAAPIVTAQCLDCRGDKPGDNAGS